MRHACLVLVLALLALAGCAAPKVETPAAPGEKPIFSQTGRASFYGRNHHGHVTASGEAFDMNALTAAHRTLEFGTVVRVTNLDSGQVVKVRINDRGPFVSGRVIDLSEKAARTLGIIDDGVARVRIEAFASDQQAAKAAVK
jgi:rare lipoprotein A